MQTIKTFVAAALITLLSSGCTTLSVPTEEPPRQFSEEELEMLIGTSKEATWESLGSPAWELKRGSKSYYVYEGRVDAEGLVWALFPVPMPVGGELTQNTVCSMLEFGPDNKLESYETSMQYFRGVELRGGGPGFGVGVGPGPPARNCKEWFWSQEELAEFDETNLRQREMRLANERERQELEELAVMGDPEAQYQIGSRSDYEITRRQKWLRLAAEQGHTDAMHTLGMISDEGSNEQWHWYCQAATRGNAKAQYQLGRGYHSGNAQGGVDLSKALFWYTLSDAGGYRENQYRCYYAIELGASRWKCGTSIDPLITEIRSDLTDEEIAEVERLLATWDPNPAECGAFLEAEANS
jgi:hypothetical protein